MPHEIAFHRSARRFTRSQDEARDLVQEAYARLFATDGWAGIANPRAYVTRSIRHIAIERIRRAKIIDFRQLVEADHAGFADDAPDPFDAAAGKDALRRFSAALARLPDRCREVFVRRRVQEQSPREISEELGISVSTLEKRLARAFYLLAQDGLGTGKGRIDEDDEPVSDSALGG